MIDLEDVFWEWLGGFLVFRVFWFFCSDRYFLVVIKYREAELCSSSIYNQNDFWDSFVVFEKFFYNNENIENEVLVYFFLVLI